MADEQDGTRNETDAADDSMWFMDGSDLITWVYRLDEPADVTAARKANLGHAYLAQIFGDIDPERVKIAVGGGVFKLKICRGREIVKNRTIAIEAPRKSFDAPPPAAVVASVATPAPPQLDTVALVKLMTESISAALAPVLAQRHEAPPAAPPLTIDSMLLIIDKIRPAPQQQRDSLEDFERHKALFESMQRTGGGGRSTGDAIVESMPHFVEMVDKVVTARVNAAAIAGARPAPARVQVAAASTLVAPPATTPGTIEAPAAEEPSGPLTMISIADQVARALRQQTTPEDLADMLDLQFTEQELGFLRTLTPATIATMLRPYVGHYPELGSEALEPYIAAVLEQLEVEPNENGSAASVVKDPESGVVEFQG